MGPMLPNQYGFGGGAQPFNPFGGYQNTFGSSPYGYSSGSLWGDIQQAPGVDFVPGLGTAANWNEMGNWERGLSLGLDALDLATMGTSKLGTTPLRMLGWSGKWLGRNDPTLAYIRSGDMPTRVGLEDLGLDIPRGYENVGPHDLVPSTNFMTQQPEAGISVHQALKFPKYNLNKVGSPQYLIKPAPNLRINYGMPENAAMYDLGKTHYTVNPSSGQLGLLGSDRPLYEVTGTPIERQLGSDLEALLDPATAKYAQTDVFGGIPIPSGRTSWGIGPNLPLAATDVPVSKYLSEFDKFDMFGNRIDSPWHDRLPSTLPWMENLPPYLGTTPLTAQVRNIMRPPVRNRGNGDTGG